jgi:hypothetical protein
MGSNPQITQMTQIQDCIVAGGSASTIDGRFEGNGRAASVGVLDNLRLGVLGAQ